MLLILKTNELAAMFKKVREGTVLLS